MKLKKKKDNKFNKKINAFLPIYINKNKLLDINSILFNGYSEFSEETLETENNQRSNTKGNVNTGINFSIYKLNSSIDVEETNNSNNKRKVSLKKVQTNSSLLSNTIDILKEYELLITNEQNGMKIGDFIIINGIFKNNSICDMLEQIYEIMSFAELATKLDNNNNNNSKDFRIIKEQIKKNENGVKEKK